MKTLSDTEYQRLIKQARVLSRDEHGDKVLRLPDDRILKLFRRKRWLSTAMLIPYAARFIRASQKMARLDVRAPVVLEVWRVPHLRRTAVVYSMIAGQPLRTMPAHQPAAVEQLFPRLASFLAMLHRKGVYFRGIHLGNVVRCDSDGELALIDISEARFRAGPLPPSVRARNFKPLVSDPDDRAAIVRFGAERFVALYLAEAGLTPRDRERLLKRLPSALAHRE